MQTLEPNELTQILRELDNIEKAIYYVGFIFWLSVMIFSLSVRKILKDKHKITALEFLDEKAESLFLEGRLDDLKTYCDDYAFSYPNDCRVHWHLGLYHFHMNDYKKALECFDKTVGLNLHYEASCYAYTDKINRAMEPSSGIETQ